MNRIKEKNMIAPRGQGTHLRPHSQKVPGGRVMV